MSWGNVTVEEFASSLNSYESNIYQTLEAANIVSADRLPEILDEIVCFVRLMIASCEHNKLSVESDFIPCGFKFHAIALMRFRLLSSLPKCKISEARQREYDAANKFFEMVACCKVRPEEPVNVRDNEAAALTVPKSVQVVSRRCDVTGRRNISGL